MTIIASFYYILLSNSYNDYLAKTMTHNAIMEIMMELSLVNATADEWVAIVDLLVSNAESDVVESTVDS